MKTATLEKPVEPGIRSPRADRPLAHPGRERLVRYYSEAGPDYGLWSRRFNMHFGFWRWPMNPLGRESMLARMTTEVLDRLRLDRGFGGELVDLGCGVGAPARQAAGRFPGAGVTGLTLVPWQVDRARELNAAAGLADRIRIVEGDYTAAPFAAASFEGAYAIESACYAPGADKAPLLREAYRLLRPGGRLVVADGFLKSRRPMNRLLRWIYDKICACWSLDEFARLKDFTNALHEAGFREIEIENISWNIAPSVLHVPLVSLKFLVTEVAREWLRGRAVGRERWNNLIAPVLSPLLGMARAHFGYYLITARK